MAGDPFGLLLRQRIIFLGGEVRYSIIICTKITNSLGGLQSFSSLSAFSTSHL